MNDSARWGFWATLLWSAAVMGVFALVQLGIFNAYLSFAAADPERLQYDGNLIAAATIATAGLCVPLVIGIATLKRGSRLADYLPFSAPPRRALLRWLGIMALVIAASDLTSLLTDNPIVPDFMRRVYASADSPLLLAAALVLAAPLFEEVFFRGFMLAGFARSRLGPGGAVALTALAWAALHVQYDWYGIATILVFGVLLGAARLRTGTLMVPLLLHVLANAFALLETAVAAAA